jgi:fatty acid desaturase
MRPRYAFPDPLAQRVFLPTLLSHEHPGGHLHALESHSTPHRNIQVGIDPEIQVMRPANLRNVILDFLWLPSAFGMLKMMTLHSFGILTKEAHDFVPQSEWRHMIWWSRLYMLIYVGMIASSIVAKSWLPLLYFPLGRLYGGWLHQLFALTQHAGLAEDVRDHRLNTRTVKLNPFFRFLYFNMNYHIEHHMYPMVPFHALPTSITSVTFLLKF